MSHPKVLTVGLPPHYAAVPEHIREQVAKDLEVNLPKAAKDANIDMEYVWVTPEDNIEKFKNELTSRPYLDAVVIGMGVRGNAQYTVLLEQLVNAIVEVAPKVKILFNSNVMTTIDAVKRWFP